MKTMSNDLFNPQKKEGSVEKSNKIENVAKSNKIRNTQQVNEMDLFGDTNKHKDSLKLKEPASKSSTANSNTKTNSDYNSKMDDAAIDFQNIPGITNDVFSSKDDIFSMDDNLNSLFTEDELDVANTDDTIDSLAKTTNHTGDTIDSLAKNNSTTNKKINLYEDVKDIPNAKAMQGYEIPNKTKNGQEDISKKAREDKHFNQEKISTDVSMKTRSSKVGDYIDKIKDKMSTESPGEKLNSIKDDNGDEITIEDKIYTGLETGCNVALNLMEGAGENLAFRLKRCATSIFSSFQNKMLKKKFKRNDNIIQYDDFMFYEMEDELMLYKYVGIETEIKIPSYVEGMPVSYLDKNFLRFNAIKSIGRGLSIDRIQDVSIENIQDNLFNVKSVQLPSTLKILPAKVFSGCKRINELIIPASVTLVQPNAFVGCRPTRIIFLGKAPKQLQDSNLAKVHIYCKQEYFDSFFKLMRNYDDYIANKTIKEKYLRLRNKILNSKDTSKWERVKRATDISDEALI